jgi:hypothetical protein
MRCSLIVILIGCVVFSKKKMQQPSTASSNYYPRLSYSFELFVPVINIGVTKEWSPQPQY